MDLKEEFDIYNNFVPVALFIVLPPLYTYVRHFQTFPNPHFMNNLLFSIFSIILLIAGSSCNQKAVNSGIPGEETLTASSPLLKLLPSSETGIDFKNYIHETFEMNITTHINTSNGGGVAIFDANNDGLQDIYMISSSAENKLYINQGKLKFADKTAGSGLESNEGFEVTVTVVDINADGWMDVYVCRGGPVVDEFRRNKLFVNNGNLTFSEKAKEYGLDDKSASIGANFFDYDNDGDLDLYLLNYPVDFSWASKIMVKPTADGKGVEPILDPIDEYDSHRFYRNDGPPLPNGDGGFKDVSKAAGVWNFGFGLSVSIEDFNQDGWMDVYVANDFIQPDLLYINNQNGTFTNKLKDYFKHTSQHTMGTELSDFDNDGLFDLFAVDMLSEKQYRKKTVLSTNSQNRYTTLKTHGYFEPVVRNVLQHNNGNSTFSDIACMANVFQTDWSWSCLMTDLDNDGWKDLLITNGYQREVTNIDFINFEFAEIEAKGSIKTQFENVVDFLDLIPQYKLRDYVFKNKGDLTFEDKSGEWMTMKASWSNGAAVGDLDNDGDMDYVVNNINDEAFVFENTSSGTTDHSFLQIKAKGPLKNPSGVGMSATIFYDRQQQYSMLTPTRGIFSSVEHLLHFGIGKASIIDSILVKWPDGKVQVLNNIPADTRLEVKYTDAQNPRAVSNLPQEILYFKDNTSTSGLSFTHKENDYIDFENSFLMPWALSDLGPLTSTADINKDGLTDIYIGNSFGKSKGLYIQNQNGQFTMLSDVEWEKDSLYEDHGSIFFDADMDGDMDLFVISGGYESPTPQAWQSRLYINDGGKKFIHAKGAIPLLQDVCLRGTAYDYDADGDIDLFLGGRVTPGKYPVTPRSYILRNDRNKFVDVTDEVSAEFGNIGMVTDLQFADIDGNALPELIVVGEWMPVTIFQLSNHKLKKLDSKKLGLQYSNGFWNKLSVADLDSDGDLDLVTGNLGLNSHYRASAEKPLKCYVSDFDNNGSIDPIMTYYEGDLSFPLVQKDVLIKQIPMLKKKYIYYKDYASATINDILTPKQIKESTILQVFVVETGWWENKNNQFVFHMLPLVGQVSPAQGIIVTDLNNDTHLDIILAGNKYGMEVETGRFDAGIGTYLAGSGDGQFTHIKNIETGFWADKDVRDIALLKGPANSLRIVVANNNDKIQIFDKTN